MQKKWQAGSDHLQKFHIWKYYLSFTVEGNKYMICMQKNSCSSTNSNVKIIELYWTELIEKKLLVIPDPLESSMSKAQEQEQKNSRNGSDLPIISMTTAT